MSFPMNRLVSRMVLVPFAVLLMTSCAATRPAPPEISLLGIQLGDLTLSHANFLANLRLYNPNSLPLTVEGVTYSFFLNGVKVADGRMLQPVKLAANDYGETVLRLTAGYLNLLQLTKALQPGENLKYDLQGEIEVGGFRILDRTFPFKREGIIDPQMLPLH